LVERRIGGGSYETAYVAAVEWLKTNVLSPKDWSVDGHGFQYAMSHPAAAM
jgi:hypothetical protein